jgi:pimeloyl-ACP methyl ester carboxylesterase
MVAADGELPALCRESARLSGAQYQVGNAEPEGDICDYPAPVLRHRKLARVAALTALGAEFDFGPALSRLNRPALVIEGERTSMPLEATRYWARHAPRARLFLVPGAGHRSWLDQPNALVRAMDRFLRGEWPDGAVEVGE